MDLCFTQTFFIQVKTLNPFRVFISWINLDFGIATCFYDGYVVKGFEIVWCKFGISCMRHRPSSF